MLRQELKVGDYVTSYYKGIFVIEKIEKRFVTENWLKSGGFEKYKLGDEYSPLVYLRKIYDSEGNKKKGTLCLDISHCKLVSIYIENQTALVKKQMRFLEELKIEATKKL